MQSSSSLLADDLPTSEYEALDLSFDDIPPIENSMSSSDPTEFTKPSATGAAAKALGGGGGVEEEYILGTLLVRIVAARNLPSVREGNVLQKLIPGQMGTTNAYASVRFGMTTQRTTTVPGTVDPLWPRQEFLYMDVTHPVMDGEFTARQGGGGGGLGGDDDADGLGDNNIEYANGKNRGIPPIKSKATRPTMAKIPSNNAVPPAQMLKSLSNVSVNQARSTMSRNISTLSQRHPAPIDPPVLTVGLFHSTASFKKYNPSKKKNNGDSDDVFLGMTSMDVTTLLTGKDRSFDDWWPLQGGPDGDHHGQHGRYAASVRVVIEYEPSDTAPRSGDKVQFTRFCHAPDLYPLLPYAVYEVQTVEGDDVTIGWTSPEGWYLSSTVKRHALICHKRHVQVAEQIIPHWGTIGERLGHSPVVQTLQTSVARVPDEGLVDVVGDAWENGKGLLARWWQGGLGTALGDVRHATNWDGEAIPTVEDSLELVTPPSVEVEEASPVMAVEEDDSVTTDRSILPNMPLCPIIQEPMKDPVVAADGHTYERAAIARWLRTSDKSPLTGAVMPHKELVPNYMLMSSLREAAAAASVTPVASGGANIFAGSILDDDDNENDGALPVIDDHDGDLLEEDIE